MKAQDAMAAALLAGIALGDTVIRTAGAGGRIRDTQPKITDESRKRKRKMAKASRKANRG